MMLQNIKIEPDARSPGSTEISECAIHNLFIGLVWVIVMGTPGLLATLCVSCVMMRLSALWVGMIYATRSLAQRFILGFLACIAIRFVLLRLAARPKFSAFFRGGLTSSGNPRCVGLATASEEGDPLP